jgi:hypothetical protein
LAETIDLGHSIEFRCLLRLKFALGLVKRQLEDASSDSIAKIAGKLGRAFRLYVTS